MQAEAFEAKPHGIIASLNAMYMFGWRFGRYLGYTRC
jgi:hypothetical protein